MSGKRRHFFGFVCSPKFFTKVEDGCWIWDKSIGSHGYGVIYYEHKLWLAHRLVYTFYKGMIPNGLTIDHLCLNQRCVNPDHLEAVTMGINVLRGNAITAINKRKTHCNRGHEYTTDNLVQSERYRRCRICDNAHARLMWKRKTMDDTGAVTKL